MSISTMNVLDSTGDTEIKWDPSNPDDVKIAEAAFKKAKKKGKLTYKMGADGNEVIHTFDPNAERIVCSAPTVGG